LTLKTAVVHEKHETNRAIALCGEWRLFSLSLRERVRVRGI